jgi:hypothetical protein
MLRELVRDVVEAPGTSLNGVILFELRPRSPIGLTKRVQASACGASVHGNDWCDSSVCVLAVHDVRVVRNQLKRSTGTAPMLTLPTYQCACVVM